jgi:hypothetical protein
MVGGLILIWMGLLFLAVTQKERFPLPINWENWWAYFIGGIGVILFIDVLLRLAMPAYRRAIVGRLIGAVILMALGLGGIYGVGTLWPLAFIAIGLAILVGAFVRW